jgi:osmotically-inducible protein OsmY
MRSFQLYAMSLTLITGIAASSAAFAAAGDQTITDQVKSQIGTTIHFDTSEHPKDGISVQTSNSVVSLKGYVDSIGQKKEADKIADSVSGVQNVQDDLIVNHDRRGRNN